MRLITLMNLGFCNEGGPSEFTVVKFSKKLENIK